MLPCSLRGGLIFWGDLVGAAYIAERLQAFSARFGPKLAGFFKPCDYLLECARTGRKLSAGVAPQSKM